MPAKKKSAKSAKKTSEPKSKKEEMQQTHAKEEKFQPTTLDQIWGDTGQTRYGHLDIEKYEKSLNEMTKADIQAEAHRIGIVPIDNREQLHRRLLTEFKKYSTGFTKPSTSGNQTKPDISEEGLRILREGR